MAYVAPKWKNSGPPALDAAALQAISDTLAKVPIENGGTGATSAAAALHALISAVEGVNETGITSSSRIPFDVWPDGPAKYITANGLGRYFARNVDGLMMQVGSYVGTGLYGSGNHNTLTFTMYPKFVWLFGMCNSSYTSGIGTKLSLIGINDGGDNNTIYSTAPGWYVSWYKQEQGFWYKSSSTYSYGREQSISTGDGRVRSLRWYNTQSASAQLNQSSTRYIWLALG